MKIERRHREAAVALVGVPRVQPRCVDQWIEGMELPLWAQEPFAKVVYAATRLAEFEQLGLGTAYRLASRAALVREEAGKHEGAEALRDDVCDELWKLGAGR